MGNCLGGGGEGCVCWLMVGTEHLMIILLSDGLHGIAHLFYMTEPPHGARTQNTHSEVQEVTQHTNSNTVEGQSLHNVRFIG